MIACSRGCARAMEATKGPFGRAAGADSRLADCLVWVRRAKKTAGGAVDLEQARVAPNEDVGADRYVRY